MSQELIYTSAPSGLKPGSRGFCTVACTEGMAGPLAERLESLSGYRPLYPAGDPRAGANPASYAHWRVSVGGRTYSVLSRVCFSGFDYTQRSNKLAHHVVLGPPEQAAGGPAWMMLRPGVLETRWSGEPRLLGLGRALPQGEDPPAACSTWAAAAGDAGWAGTLAESFVLDASRPAYLICSPGQAVLPLINEAIALLPHHLRWQVTFNTYFTDLPAASACAWRCCIAGTPAAKDAIAAGKAGAVVIDLTRQLGRAADSRYVVAARTGETAAGTAGRGTPVGERTAEQDEQDAAIALPRGSGKRRLAAVSAAAAGDGGAADQSWMPPAGATVVEFEGPDGEPPRRAKATFWAVALAWPVVIAVVVLLVLGRYRSPAHPPQSAVLPDPPATQPVDATALAEAHRTNESLRRQNANLLSERERVKNDLADKLAKSEGENARLAEQVKNLQQQLQQPAKSSDVAPGDRPRGDGSSRPADVKQMPPLPDATANIREAQFPKSGTDDQKLTDGLHAEPGVELAFLDGSPDQGELHARIQGDKTLRIERVWQRVGSLDSGQGKVTLATLSVAGGDLHWQWAGEYANDQTGKRAQWDAALRLAAVRVHVNGQPVLVQFRKLHRASSNLTSESSEVIQEAAKPIFEQAQLEPQQPIPAWGYERPDRHVLDVKRDDLSFRLYQDSDQLAVRSTWSRARATLAEQMKRRNEERVAARDLAELCKGKITTLEKESQQAAGKDSAGQGGTAEQIAQLQAQEKEARERELAAAAAVEHDTESLKKLDGVQPFQLLMKLPNGVVVASLVVQVPVPEEK